MYVVCVCICMVCVYVYTWKTHRYTHAEDKNMSAVLDNFLHFSIYFFLVFPKGPTC
jgi:hypothetical protein